MKPLVCGWEVWVLCSSAASQLSWTAFAHLASCPLHVTDQTPWADVASGFALGQFLDQWGLWSQVATAVQTVAARRRAKEKKRGGGRKAILLFSGQCAQLKEHCSPAKPPREISLTWLFPE